MLYGGAVLHEDKQHGQGHSELVEAYIVKSQEGHSKENCNSQGGMKQVNWQVQWQRRCQERISFGAAVAYGERRCGKPRQFVSHGKVENQT